jgi:hypothetical protein
MHLLIVRRSPLMKGLLKSIQDTEC